MFSSIFKRGVVLAALGCGQSSLIFSDDHEDMVKKLKIIGHLPTYQESSNLDPKVPTLLYIYDTIQIDKLDPKLENLFKNSQNFGYSVQKKFVGSKEDTDLIKEKLQISEDELEFRLKHNSNFVFINGQESYKIPIGTQLKDIDSWVAKCQEPFFKVFSPAKFFSFTRKVITDHERYVVVCRDLSPENKKVVEMFSRLKYTLPVLELDSTTCDFLGIKEGVTIARLFSKFDGDFEADSSNKLKFLNFSKPTFTLDELEN